MRYKVSVIVPCYNSSRTIYRCTESLINQEYYNWELILVDDGSTDNTPSLCDEISQKDSRIKVLHKENGGVSSARNLGLQYAEGDYIMFLDSDDYLDKECLGLIDIEGKNVDILFFGIQLNTIDGSYKHWSDVPNKSVNGQKEKEIFIKEYITTDLFRSPCAKFFKKDKLSGITFNEKMKLGEDTDFVLRVANDCSHFIFLDRYYYYCQDSSSVFLEKYKMSAKDSTYNFEMIIQSYKKLGVESFEFEKFMFHVFYSVIDGKSSYDLWFKSTIVKCVEKKCLKEFDSKFQDQYLLNKNPKLHFLYRVYKLMLLSPRKSIKYIDDKGSIGKIRPLFFQKIFYKIKKRIYITIF